MKTRNLSGGFIEDHDSSYVDLIGHKAEITCMRDNTIRLWWKGSCQLCFPGHRVTTLSEKLLGSNGNVFASGDKDGTVRLWSLSASRKRRRESLQARLYGHRRPIKFVSVAGHDQRTLVASIDTDSEVRLWDAASSSCVGKKTSLATEPDVVSMKSHESLLYIAVASYPLVAIDLRTMRKVITVTAPRVNSFAMLPCQSLLCTGGEDGKAMLWDTRRSSQSVAEMVGHNGSITQLHMDRYKIVTGGPKDVNVNVWETDTGTKVNSFECCNQARQFSRKCSAMAVQGYKIVSCGGSSDICFRNFSTATLPKRLRLELTRLL